MGDMRFLVRAVVLGVNDTNVVYPCCIQCYSKMLHNIRQNVWQCIRCNIITTASQVMWRYRLSLSVADSSASCHVSLFGGTLIPYFGCSANEFHRFVLSTCIQEDKIQQALDLTLRGKSYLFGLKIAMSPNAKQPKQETICRPVCLANLLNSHHTSNFHDGKLTDFIATQMIHVPLESQSSACLTIITMLKNLISRSLVSSPRHVASQSAEGSAVSSNQKESHKSQNSSSSSDKISHCEVEPGGECRDQHPHSPMGMKRKPLTEVASGLTCRSADLGWFTCDSSMEQAFPSQVDTCLPRSCQTEGITSIGENLSTSLEKSFGILHATCSVGPDPVKCSKQTLQTTRKPLRNTTVCTRRFQGRNPVYSQASASERRDTGASDHNGRKTAADDFSPDASLTGLEPQHFSTQVCDDRISADSWFCEDGAESLSTSLNDSVSLLGAVVEETNCHNAPDVGKSVLDIGKSVSNVGKSESAPQEKSTTLAPWAVKLIKGRNSTAAVNCGSLRKVERNNILSVLNQKEEIEKIRNNLKSASHLDHNSSNLLEHLGSGQVEEDDSRHQSRIPSYHICSLDVDLAMPDSEDLSLFLNAAAIEMADSKPCPIIKASKPKYQEQSQLECWQQRHLTGNKRTSWSEKSVSCLNSQLVLQESVEVHSEQWLLSQNRGDNSHLCLAVTEPWCSTDHVQVTENEQSENDLNGGQGSREQLMQSNRRENSSNKMAGVWGPSQPLTLSRRKQPYKTKRNAGSTCTVSGEAQSGCESPHSFAQSLLPSIQGSVDSVPSHVQSDLTHSHDASADLFGSQSQTDASKGDSDEMSCQRPDKQVDVSDFIAHLDNFGNNAAKDLLLYRKCLLSTPALLHARHTPEWSSASITALSQGSQTFCETEMEIPECSSKKRVRFSRRHSRISTIPSIDFLMAQYPSPINHEQESTPTATPVRSCLKGAVLNPRDHCNGPQMATPDINKPTTPLDASTPMSTRRYWLSSPLDKMQNSGSQELYSPSESGNKTCISIPDKNAKTLLHHHTPSSESCKCSSGCTTLKWEQKETIDRRRLFHIPNVQAENASRKLCSKGSEDRHCALPFCKTTNQKVCRHSIHNVIKMSQDYLWQGQTANTEKHSVTSSNKGILFCNALKQGNATNTEMVPAQQAICFCDGSLVLFDESDLDSDGISQPFSKQTKIMTKRHTCTSRNTNRGHEIPSPRQRVMKLACSDCSPSLFSQ